MSLKHDIERRWKRRNSAYIYVFKHGVLTVFLPNNKKVTYRYFITDRPGESSITINNVTYLCRITRGYQVQEMKVTKPRSVTPVYLDPLS